MGLGQAAVRLVAGIGCRRDAPVEAVEAAVSAALREAGRDARELSLIATLEAKAAEPGIVALSRRLGLRIVVVAQHHAAAQAVPTDSAASRAATGLGSVAEAAALAAAGPGARLLGPRQASGAATCALAEGAE
jgi:cobalamin biosynthesis protein CbiG